MWHWVIWLLICCVISLNPKTQRVLCTTDGAKFHTQQIYRVSDRHTCSLSLGNHSTILDQAKARRSSDQPWREGCLHRGVRWESVYVSSPCFTTRVIGELDSVGFPEHGHGLETSLHCEIKVYYCGIQAVTTLWTQRLKVSSLIHNVLHIASCRFSGGTACLGEEEALCTGPFVWSSLHTIHTSVKSNKEDGSHWLNTPSIHF